jgi:hypothetical protein
LKIIIEIEKTFGIQFSANQITNIQCIKDILEILNNKKKIETLYFVRKKNIVYNFVNLEKKIKKFNYLKIIHAS